MSRFTSNRSRALRMSALVSLLMVMGCPTSPTDTSTPTGVVPATVTKPGQGASPTTVAGSTVTGTVTGAGGKSLSGVTVTLTDARAIQVPNSGDAKTDGAGKFTLKQVPVSSTWLVLADVDGNRMAGLVKPNAKKTVDCKISLTTTLAIAGIQPYFVEDVKAPDRVVYDLRDLPLDKFDALVAAIEKASPAPDIKPSAKLKDLNPTFTGLMGKDTGVKAAFDALFQQIQTNSLIRQAGGTPDPNVVTPKPGGSGATPTPGATATVTLATAVPTPTPTPTPSGFGATPTPLPTKNYSPLTVTLTKDTPTMASTATAIGADVITVNGQTALLIPDDSKIHVIAALPGIPDLDPATSLGAAVDSMQAIVVFGTKVYTIANVGGVPSVITMTVDATLQATATSMPLVVGSGIAAMTKASGLAFISFKNALIASDAAQHVLMQVDLTTGAETLYAGIAGKSDTPGTAKGPAAGFGLNAPLGLTQFNGVLYICDSGNHRILRVEAATSTIEVYSGSATDGGTGKGGNVTTTARYKKPTGIFAANNQMVIADADDNCVRVIDIIKNDSYQTTGAATDNNQFIFKCRMATLANGKIYAANSSGKIVHFDPPTLPN
ncbi:MAG: hypothetical protein JWM80_671 [Cyanobacteria bacterium RYN_339]|nr:hypothetical protein [Cyanobacteria bacterium RYN_339]